MRVIADHLRAMTFLIADGVVPSNEWRGYVLRKIMRRAMRHGKKLGFTEPVLHDARRGGRPRDGRRLSASSSPTSDTSSASVRSEEERFDAVLTAGLPRLEEALDRAPRPGARLPGDEAFRLYDSLGVPLDFMEDVAGQRRLGDRSRGIRAGDGGAARNARAPAAGSRAAKGADVRPCRRTSSAALASAADEFAGYDSTPASTGMPVLGALR